MFEAQKKFLFGKLVESRRKLEKITQPASYTNPSDFSYGKVLLLYFLSPFRRRNRESLIQAIKQFSLFSRLIFSLIVSVFSFFSLSDRVNLMRIFFRGMATFWDQVMPR